MSNATTTATTVESSPPAGYWSTKVEGGMNEAAEEAVQEETVEEVVEGADGAAEGADNAVEGANVEAPDEVEIEADADCTTPLPQTITLNRYTKVSPNQLIPISQDYFDDTGSMNPKRVGKSAKWKDLKD